MLRPDQREFFARSIVNRVWYRLMGFGLVMPLDQMHAENPSSHPELLQWLARDMAEHGYDVRRLIRGVVLTKAYARSSRWEGDGTPPKPALFAVARVRALTPLQLATSLRLATSDQGVFATGKPDEIEKRLEGLEHSAQGMARWFEQPNDDFQIGVAEALLLSNARPVQDDLLSEGGDRLLGKLKQVKDPGVAADAAIRSVLSRPPTDEERKLLGEYLGRRGDRVSDGCRQMVWALLTSAEFRFNY